MGNIVRVYRYLNLLSLDVAAGAVICAAFFACIVDVRILPYGLIALGLTVWIIYTTDHLLDARKIQKAASTERHRFHQRHFKTLLIMLPIAALIDGLQLFYIRGSVFVGGLVLGFIIVIYFIVQRHLTFLKEIFGAVLYTGGVLLVPFSLMNEALTVSQVIFVVQFLLIALTNLLLFSWFDRTPDERDNHRSFTIAFGENMTQKAITCLFISNAVLSVLQLTFNLTLYAELILVFMNAVLLVIFFNKKYFEKNDRYRLVGDAIFLAPIFFILT